MLDRLKKKIRSKAEAGEAAEELRQAELELEALRQNYRSGEFSGHPEEMLEAIEHAEYRLNRLRTA